MGAIWITGADLIEFLHEVVGFKMGLAVSERDLRDGFEQAAMNVAWPADQSATYRYRSEEIEAAVGAILRHFGDPDARPDGIAPTFEFIRQHGMGPDGSIVELIVEAFGEAVEAAPRGSPLDPKPILIRVEDRFGRRGLHLAVEFLRTVNASQHVSPWNRMRRREWTDVLALRDLFESEEVAATYGTFFDQRFIDFLEGSTDNVDRMNWRKFEALAAEWFDRQGLSVELGAGRGDGGVDLRVWPSRSASQGPALLIAQCKRQKRKVDQVVLKALFADMTHEGADRGLIVTTSTISPSAEQLIQSREYPIDVVDRSALRRWLQAMRTPGAGLWLPE